MWNYIVCLSEAPENSATDGQKEAVQAKPTLPAGNLKQEPQAEPSHTTLKLWIRSGRNLQILRMGSPRQPE